MASSAWSRGSLVSTVLNLSKFLLALSNDSILQEKFRDLMWNSTKLTVGKTIDFNLGGELMREMDGKLFCTAAVLLDFLLLFYMIQTLQFLLLFSLMSVSAM